jgi:hypothetical protein
VSLEERIAEKRDAKATKVVLWLEAATSTSPICRRCWLRLHRDADDRWADELGRTRCLAPGFRNNALVVEHKPETWPPARVKAADEHDRDRISALAGLDKPCSERTWERVAVLYEARADAREGP